MARTRHRFASLSGCGVRRLPTKYLGLPLGASHRFCAEWDLVEKDQEGD